IVIFASRIFYAQYPLPQAAVLIIGGGILQVFINSFYAGLFGNFFDNLLKAGVKFNWILFLFATVIIFSVKYVFTNQKTMRKLKKLMS
ncbi:MAG: hypothetical protein KKF44_06650, partial [Nanoarchaeota archaeon]|nr:hypothetical protein [Nanoarchaeota archaeon]